MRFLALATDYDGTLATHGSVERRTIAALAALRRSGRALLLVTGRELWDLKRVFTQLELFDRVVAENGALIYRPPTGDETLLCEPACAALAAGLRALGAPCSAGKAVVATAASYEASVRGLIRELQLNLQITFNRSSLMALPPGVDKGSGLKQALAELGVAAPNAVAVGDAENDLALFAACGFAAAVGDAVPALKSRADLVTSGAQGAGVAEVIDHLLADDLAALSGGPRRR